MVKSPGLGTQTSCSFFAALADVTEDDAAADAAADATVDAAEETGNALCAEGHEVVLIQHRGQLVRDCLQRTCFEVTVLTCEF